MGFGGSLAPEWLLDAYAHGIFPWPMADWEGPIPWWSPDPRAVIRFERFHVSRRLQSTCRGRRFQVTRNQDFAGVIRGCATQPGREGNTWITPEMMEAYVRLHRFGHAHSVEVWHEGRLVGGTYGVAVGGLFSAESMFHLVRDASNVALVYLVEHLRGRGFSLLDVQQYTAHSARFGAEEIPRKAFLELLAEAVARPVSFE